MDKLEVVKMLIDQLIDEYAWEEDNEYCEGLKRAMTIIKQVEEKWE